MFHEDDASAVGRDFFERKVIGYDEKWRGAYARLVDALQWSVLELSVFCRLPHGFTFLDIGGGAGRWTHRIATHFPDSRGMLCDLSPGMVSQARDRAVRHGYEQRVRFRNADVHDVAALLSGQTFDFVFNSHHLLGFVPDPGAVIISLTRLLSVDGLMVSFLPNRWHAAFEDLAAGETEHVVQSLEGSRWATNSAPYRHLFTPGEIRATHAAANLKVDLLTGFPSLIYPDIHEAPDARSERTLQDEKVFQRVLTMEKELLIDPDSGGRGANLFVVASHATPHIR
ncbi:class I SAM-dependent methyltransferase (plasmid) [Streptomyces sp. AHU1]|uniref:class I SAM-dependent methyltransferase n=1 Tax=Streptomyces sp. AHU1 TaxID=3377215 RepID=UPI003877B0BA